MAGGPQPGVLFEDQHRVTSPSNPADICAEIRANHFNVNILRGAQGTGNDRGASADAIKVDSKKPTREYDAILR